MAIAYSIVDQTVFGNHKVKIVDITFDNSYPTGGEAISLAALGLQSVLFAHLNSKSGYVLSYDYTNNKILAYNPTAAHTHTENTAGSYTQNATTAANTVGVASQVADTTDLSALVFRAMFVGQ